MYDEFERAVTGKSHEGLSFLGWLTVALGTLFTLGVVGAGLTAYYVHARVSDFADEISRGASSGLVQASDVASAAAAAAMVDRLESHARLLDTSPEDGLALLQDLGSGAPSDAFVDRILGGSVESLMGRTGSSVDPPEGLGRHVAVVRSEDGEVRVNVVREADGGSLVIDSDDGRVRFNLRKTADGGFLAIDSDDGQVRFDLVRSDDGGSLIIRSDDGEVRFDVVRGEDGGSLVLRTEDGTFRFDAGSEARAMPGWVRRVDGMPEDPEPVYSLESPDGVLGAVTWQGDGSPQEIISFYRSWLEGQGYELRAEHRLNREGEDRASLWARNENDGRMVFVLAEQDAEVSRVLLGYGEGEG